jgi:hypothetical protein
VVIPVDHGVLHGQLALAEGRGRPQALSMQKMIGVRSSSPVMPAASVSRTISAVG